jgi:hypothetical protein
LKNNGIVHKLGKHWYTGYLVRNPEIRSSRIRLINYKRANAASIDNINIFFDRLKLPEVRIIPPQNIWNADEIELMMEVGNNGIMIGEAYRKFMLSKDAGTRKWVSILKCCSATGRVIPPLVIFAGKYTQQQWFPDDDEVQYKKWYFYTSSTG